MFGTYWHGLQRRASCWNLGLAAAVLAAATIAPFGAVAVAQDVKHYRFAYDQPKTTGYGVAGDKERRIRRLRNLLSVRRRTKRNKRGGGQDADLQLGFHGISSV